MKTNIQSIGFTAQPALVEFINEKTNKLKHHLENIISCEVTLSTDNSSTKENKVCHIRLVIPGNDLLASSQNKTFEEAASHTSDSLIKQIEKYKTKILSKRVGIDDI
ncbi:ribosome hibernation-promoting factor, HPF/YfiA family [Limnovirga soli]|nr:ribosome-associated translation inhibitor RaiA [Limnovirga soli]